MIWHCSKSLLLYFIAVVSECEYCCPIAMTKQCSSCQGDWFGSASPSSRFFSKNIWCLVAILPLHCKNQCSKSWLSPDEHLWQVGDTVSSRLFVLVRSESFAFATTKLGYQDLVRSCLQFFLLLTGVSAVYSSCLKVLYVFGNALAHHHTEEDCSLFFFHLSCFFCSLICEIIARDL